MREYQVSFTTRDHKALHKAVAVMNKRSNVQRNQIHHLEDSMIMYGVYNSDTLKDLIDMVHRMQNFTTWNKKRLLLVNYMIGWNCICEMKVCAIMP